MFKLYRALLIALFASLCLTGSASASFNVFFTKEFQPSTIPAGGTSTLVFTIDASGNPDGLVGVSFTDPLPASVLVASPANASTTCTGGTITAVSGTGTITYSGGNVPASTTCTLSVDVTSAVSGDHLNVSGDLTHSGGNDGNATATLTVLAPAFTKAFAPNPIFTNGTAFLTFTIDNSAAGIAASALDFTDNLPAGLTVAPPGLSGNSCIGGTVTAAPGSSVISYTGGSVPANSFCSFSVPIAPSSAGSFVNTTGDLTSTLGNSGTATDTLIVFGPPAFSKSFVPDVISIGEVSTLIFTIDNSATGIAASALDFTDNLPAGLVVASPENAATTCTGGVLTAPSGATSVSYSGGTVDMNASCEIQVDVTAASQGAYANVSRNLTSSSGDSGTAEDTLVVNGPRTGCGTD